MAQWEKGLVAQPDDLSSIPGPTEHKFRTYSKLSSDFFYVCVCIHNCNCKSYLCHTLKSLVVVAVLDHVLLEIPLTLIFTDNSKKNKFCSAKIISIPWHIIYFEAKHFSNKLSSSPRISKNSDTIGGILQKNGRYTKMLQDCLALHRRDGVGQVQNLPRLLCG